MSSKTSARSPSPPSPRIAEHFAELTDPRRVERVTHPLVNIVTMAICAVIGGADDFVAIHDFCLAKQDWFATFLDLRAGVPSHDVFNRVLARLLPAEFEKCLLSFVESLHELTAGQVVAIDGKTLRRSYDHATGKAAIHMVSAWATANCVSLGQVVTDAKSNEITAIPKLLETLEIAGSLVTIDALGCQVEIAQKIVDAKADYLLAVKGNQPTLHEGLQEFFVNHLEDDFARTTATARTTVEKGHGRVERRHYYVCPAPQDLPDRERWPKLKTIALAINITTRGGKETCEVRHYVSSRKLSAKAFAEAARGHWGIENQLHWQLDVTFGEDQSRIRKGHADTNFSLLRRVALTMLKRNQGRKCGVKNKRLSAGWDANYLAEVLLGK